MQDTGMYFPEGFRRRWNDPSPSRMPAAHAIQSIPWIRPKGCDNYLVELGIE